MPMTLEEAALKSALVRPDRNGSLGQESFSRVTWAKKWTPATPEQAEAWGIVQTDANARMAAEEHGNYLRSANVIYDYSADLSRIIAEMPHSKSNPNIQAAVDNLEKARDALHIASVEVAALARAAGLAVFDENTGYMEYGKKE